MEFINQCAVCTKVRLKSNQISPPQISSAVHPHKTEKFTLEEKMIMEVNYCLNHLSKDPLYSDSWENAVIPIENLHKYVKLKEFFKTEEDLR